MEIVGKAVQPHEVAAILESANVEAQVRSGSLLAKAITTPGGEKQVIVEDMNGSYLSFALQ
jgi:hypothetical protein